MIANRAHETITVPEERRMFVPLACVTIEFLGKRDLEMERWFTAAR